jgi:hypothetical protein
MTGSYDDYEAKFFALCGELTLCGQPLKEDEQLVYLKEGIDCTDNLWGSVVRECKGKDLKATLKALREMAARLRILRDDEKPQVDFGLAAVRGRRGPSRPRVCDHCHRPGHFKATCWDLHPELAKEYHKSKNVAALGVSDPVAF